MEMVAPIRNIAIVDDDPSMRDALTVVFTVAGYRVSLFPDAEAFLSAASLKVPAALLIDLHLPGLSGLSLLKRLNATRYGAPIIMISGDADIAQAVEAVKCGAFDYMVKPLEGRDVVARVGNAIAAFERDAKAARAPRPIAREFPGRATLTPRERQVLTEIANGASNKEAGRRLGISPRTVEVHRARIMEKTGARNTADLVRIVFSGGNPPNGHNHPPGLVA